MTYQLSFIKGMTKKKLTQTEAIFYLMYKSFKNQLPDFRKQIIFEGKNDLSDTKAFYIPVFKFMGEIYCEELGLWGYVSHECSARCSELKKVNRNLIDVTTIEGKSGARYYGYRFSPNATPSLIDDPKLKEFYKLVAKRSKKR